MSTYAAQFTDEEGEVRLTGTIGYTDPTNVPVESSGGIFIPPTSDPLINGAVWNSSGTLTVSTGP